MVARRIWVPLFIVLIAVPGVWSDAIASFRLNEAYALHRAGKSSEALAVLEPVFDDSEIESDYYFLQSSILSQLGNPPAMWLPPLEKAYQLGSWNRYGESDAMFGLVDGYITTQRYGDALALMANTFDLIAADPQLSYFYAVALERTGNTSESDAFLRQALSVHPDSVPLHLLRMRRSTSYSLSVAERVLSSGLYADSPEILREVVLSHRTIPDHIRLACLDLIMSKGISDTSLQIEALSLADEIDPASVTQIIERFPRMRSDVERLSTILAGTEWEEPYRNAAMAFSGPVTDDLDDDSIHETTTVYIDGAVQEMTVDRNQDGIDDLAAVFDGGNPVHAEIAADGSSYDLVFGSYPYVSSVNMISGGNETVFSLKTGALIFPFASVDEPMPLRFVSLRIPEMPSVGELAALSKIVTTRSTDPRLQHHRIDYRSGGLLTTTEEYHNGSLMKRINYTGGVPSLAQSDTDADGTFDMSEVFTDGEATAISYDEDWDGTFEYRHLIDQAVEEWDFNDDGVIDCRELYSVDSVTRRYSSNMDGVLDITIVVGDEFVRNGTVMKLYQDSFGNYWIGTRPREELLSRVSVQSGDGAESLMTFTIRGKRYIEVVR